MSTDEGGWRWQEAIIHRAFPGLQISSAFRNNSVAHGGGLDYHSRGRAIDMPPMPTVFDWIATNYPQTAELIFSPMNNRQIKDGAPHLYSEPTRGDHWTHVHWAIIGGTNPDGSDGPQPGQGGGGIVTAGNVTGTGATNDMGTFDAVSAWATAGTIRAAALVAGGGLIYYGLKRSGGIP